MLNNKLMLLDLPLNYNIFEYILNEESIKFWYISEVLVLYKHVCIALLFVWPHKVVS